MTPGDQLQNQTQLGLLLRRETQADTLYSFFCQGLWQAPEISYKLRVFSFTYMLPYQKYTYKENFAHIHVIDSRVFDV